MPTWEDLQARAGKYINQLLNEHESAPSFGAYNKLLGKRATSKRDVIKAAIENIKLLNQISNMLFEKDVVSFDHEEVKIPKMTIND